MRQLLRVSEPKRPNKQSLNRWLVFEGCLLATVAGADADGYAGLESECGVSMVLSEGREMR